MTYPCVIEQAAFQVILTLGTKERRLLHDAFRRMMDAPFQEPDLREMIDGHEVMVRFFGPFAVTYWLDHAVKEIRIVSLFRD